MAHGEDVDEVSLDGRSARTALRALAKPDDDVLAVVVELDGLERELLELLVDRGEDVIGDVVKAVVLALDGVKRPAGPAHVRIEERENVFDLPVVERCPLLNAS